VQTFVSPSSARGEEVATSKPQTIIMGIATIDILETNFFCIETSF
jgi:hypothetical protein